MSDPRNFVHLIEKPEAERLSLQHKQRKVPKNKRTPAQLAAAKPWRAELAATTRTYTKRFATEDLAFRFIDREWRQRRLVWTVQYRPD